MTTGLPRTHPDDAHSSRSPLIEALRAAAYTVPTDVPEADGTLTWNATTTVVCQVEAAGVTGLGYTYCDQACVPLIEHTLAPLIIGREVFDIPGSWVAMQRAIRNIGWPGMASCCLSAVETALYDLKAKVLDRALVTLFGRVRAAVPIYGSGGFTSYDDSQTRRQVQRWVDDLGITRVKLKIGESWGSDVRRDLRRVALVRQMAGERAEVYVDANGGYTVGQAVRVGRMLADHGVTWFEEPVSSDHLDGLREIRSQIDPDVTAGEYGYHLPYFATMLRARAVDCLQVDVTRCGGFGEWFRVAALAAGDSIDISGHCAPNLAVHVAAATPNLRHLEYFHDHHRIERMLFDGALSPRDGQLWPDTSRPGHGLALAEEAAEPYRVR